MDRSPSEIVMDSLEYIVEEYAREDCVRPCDEGLVRQTVLLDVRPGACAPAAGACAPERELEEDARGPDC